MTLILGIFMFQALSKVLILSVMLFPFIGQAMANDIFSSCETSAAASVDIQLNENINPDDAANSTENTDDCCDDECCDSDCICALNGCSPVTYLTVGMDYSELVLISELSYIQQSFVHPKSISTSRYRPPIFTS